MDNIFIDRCKTCHTPCFKYKDKTDTWFEVHRIYWFFHQTRQTHQVKYDDKVNIGHIIDLNSLSMTKAQG